MKEDKEFNELETGVLEYMFSIDNENAKILRTQLQHAAVSERDFTGAGFFTNIIVDKDKCKPTTGEVEINEPAIETAALVNGGGFVLFLADGYLNCLEGYSYSEDWPKDIKDFILTPAPWKTSKIK